MTVTCPNCQTLYNLHDEKARPGAKLRCTVCGLVFSLPDAGGKLADVGVTGQQDFSSRASGQGDSGGTKGSAFSISLGGKKNGKQKMWPFLVVLLVVVLVVSGVAIWRTTHLLDPLKALLGVEIPLSSEELERQRAAQFLSMVESLGLSKVRQYYVNNEKIGRIMAIEGKVTNEFSEPRELIRVEAELLDHSGSLLFNKSQLAGTMVTMFQLQVLSQEELENALNNKLDVLTNNTNVPPGGEVPFMIVFYNPPSTAAEYSVRVIDARRPEQTTR